MAQQVKNPPAMQETQVQSLSWEDPLEKGMATHSSILIRWGVQVASRVATGKAGLHGRGKGERVIALKSG